MIPAAADFSAVVTAVVHAPEGVRFVAAGRSPEQITAALEDYVLQRCDDVLWPSAARRVRELIEARDPDAAIASYFANVGSRWDEERLAIHVTNGEQ
jgi:hypothetical protein